MKTSSWIAIGLFAAAAAWLASGYIIDGGDEDEEDRAATAQPTLVEVRSSEARTVPQYIFAQGSAQPFRTADVVGQATGTIDAVLVQEGDQVRADTVVARIRLDARSSRRESAQARVETLEPTWKACASLRKTASRQRAGSANSKPSWRAPAPNSLAFGRKSRIPRSRPRYPAS